MQSKANRRWLWAAAILAVILIGVAVITPAFGREQAVVPAQDTVAALPAVAVIQPESAPSEVQPNTAASSAESPSDDMPVADTPSSDNCIACHTNQVLLQQLAVEPEKIESELAAGEG